MSPEDFREGFPGQLVPTTGWEEYSDRHGRPATRQTNAIAFIPDPLPPSIDLTELVGEYGAAREAVGELRGLAGDLQYSRLLAAPLLQREARVSSKIENTIATAEEVAVYEAGRPTTRSEAVEVSNYRAALTHGLWSDLPLSRRLVCEMHAMLLRGVRGENTRPGEVRAIQNRIGGERDGFATARFVPPPPGEPLERGLHDLELFWNRPPEHIPPLIAIALAHYQFEALHPFADGNGRLGRAVAILSICRMGLLDEPLLYLSGYLSMNRDEYYDRLLRVSTHGEWIEWCGFFLRGVAAQARDSAARLRQIRELREETTRRLQEANAPGRALSLVDSLIERPFIDAKWVCENLGVTYPTARNYIERLVQVGFLRELTGESYGKVWGATPIFAIIDADDG